MGAYLVTGGAGFIGSHLCEELLKEHKVTVLDNLSTGSLENVPKDVQFIQGDVGDCPLLEEVMAQVDGCFHLAAVVSIPLCNEDLLNAHAVNLTGTLNILKSAQNLSKKGKKIPVVFASSSAVYGDSQTLPHEEKNSPTVPISAYGLAKLGSEYYGRFVHELYGVPFTALRLFNVYGIRQKLDSIYSGVISIFLHALLQDKPCIFYGDGEQTRDFVFVKDVVQFFIKAMDTSSDSMRVYNVCTGKSTTIQTIARVLSQVIDKKLVIAFKPQKIGDIRHSIGSPLLAQNELGILAQTPIELGLRSLVKDVQVSQ